MYICNYLQDFFLESELQNRSAVQTSKDILFIFLAFFHRGHRRIHLFGSRRFLGDFALDFRRNRGHGFGHTLAFDVFEIDRGHEDGAEIHSVTDTGIIIVRNKRNNVLITELIARPQQLRKLYASDNRKVPRELLRLAYTYTIAGYNTV